MPSQAPTPAGRHIKTQTDAGRGVCPPAPLADPAKIPRAKTLDRPSLREKLIKIAAKVVSHGRYVTFQMAEVGVSRQMFAEILSLIGRLRAPPAPA
jgi:hypothetical protein